MSNAIVLTDLCRPSELEPYMNARQLRYFEYRLLAWRQELAEQMRHTLVSLRGQERDVGDEADDSTSTESQTLQLITTDRCRKLLLKIDAALYRIRNGDYGFCEVTGEPIGLARLEARPIATLCLYAQEIKERKERSEGFWRPCA